MRTGPELREEHTLRDGTTVVLRHVQPTDKEELRRAFQTLSPESRYRRFFAALGDLDEAMLHYLTEVDGKNHVAIVAMIETPDLKERGAGIVRFVRLADDPSGAEIAVTVVDDMQNKGLGALLLATAAVAAHERHITHFVAEVLASNGPVVRALTDLGAETHGRSEGSITFSLPLEDEAPTREKLSRFLRLAALEIGAFITSRLPSPPKVP